MSEIVFPAGWYRREDYERIRLMMDDPDNFPETFDEWAKLAEGQLSQFIAQGMPVEKVIIDPDGFAAFCREAKIKPDREARVRYAATVLGQQKPGHA
jgi:hypothetical protein